MTPNTNITNTCQKILTQDIPAFILRFKPDSTITFANERYAKCVKTNPDEIMGKKWFDLIPDPACNVAKTNYKKLNKEQPTAVYVIKYIDKENNEHFHRWHNKAIFDESGNITEYQAVGFDITDEHVARQQLKQANDKLRQAEEIADLGYWHLDIPHNSLTWSDQIYEIFEIEKNEKLTYDKFLKSVHPKDRKRVDNAWNAAMKGKKYDIEHRIIVDGKVKWVHQKAKLYFTEDGDPIEGIGVMQDITRHNKIDRALRSISAINNIILKADSEEEILKKTCAAIVREGDYQLAWIGYKQRGAEKKVKPVSSAGHKEGYLDSIKITWGDDKWGQGPTGTSIRTGETVINRNVQSNPKYKPWREEALERGYNSSMAIPLKIKDKTIGALNIYASEVEAFSQDEVDILEKLAKNLSFGIKARRNELLRHETEGKLQKTQQLYKSIFENSGTGTCLIDQDGTIILANTQLSELYSAEKEQIVGQTWDVFLPAYEKERLKKIRQKRFAGEDVPNRYRFDLIDKQKQVHRIDLTIDTIPGTKTMIASMRDITQLLATQEQAQLYQKGFESSPNSMVLVCHEDGEPVIEKVNRGFEKIYGYTKEEALGKNPNILKSGEQDKEYYKKMWGDILNPEIGYWQDEIVNKRKDGKLVDVILTISTIFDENDIPKYFMAHHVDITNRKKAERKVEQLDKLKSRFITALTHVTRTPLTKVRWAVETLIDGSYGQVPKEQQVLLRQILKSNHEVLWLIQNMNIALDIERDTLKLEKSPTSINSLISSALGTHKQQCKIKNISCEIDMPDNLPATNIDAEKIRKVLDILIGNAERYTPEQGNISLSTTKTDHKIRIEISDDGIGIPKGEQKHIFKRFFRASNAATMYPDGVGLGLYIAKHIVEAHGGEMEFESELEEGSTFWFTLPIA